MRPGKSHSLVALLLVVALSGCGGESAGEGGMSTTTEAEYPSGPTREFIVPGESNLVQEFGREATLSEREEVSDMIEAWMRARAAGHPAKECPHIHKAIIKRILEASTYDGVRGCRDTVARFRKRYRPSPALAPLANTMTGPIDSLRLGEGHGYAQYHGRGGRDWIVTVRREGREWKVSGMDPIDRMK